MSGWACKASRAEIVLYFTLQLLGLIGLLLMALTFVFSVRRHATIVNNAFLWSFSCAAHSLLFLTGHLSGAEPPAALCQLQSAFILALPPTLAAAALCIVFKVWSLAWTVNRESFSFLHEPKYVTTIYVVFPYCVLIGAATAGVAVGSHSPVVRFDYYCVSTNTTIARCSGGLAAAFLIIQSVLLVWALYLVVRRYLNSRRLGRNDLGDNIPLLVRITLFIICTVVGLVLSLWATGEFSDTVGDILVAAIAPTLFFIFSSQKDVLTAWGLLAPPRPLEHLPRRLSLAVDIDLRRASMHVEETAV